MRVKIGNNIYDSEKQPIMIILSNEEKELISNMAKDNYKFCSFPEDADIKEIKRFMEDWVVRKIDT